MRPIWKILIVAVVVLVLLVALLVVPHYRAKAALEKYRAQLKRQGAKMTIVELTPSLSVEGLDNGRALLAAANMVTNLNYVPPMMRRLAPGHSMVGWAETSSPTDDTSNCWPIVREVFNKHREGSDAMRAALQKSGLEFPVNYAGGFSALLTHLAPLKKASLWLAGSTMLAMHTRDTNGAWQDLRAEANLVRMNNSEPLLISQLVRIAMTQIAISGLWEGLQYPGWSDAQLAELQTNWDSFDLLDHLEPSMDMERVSGAQVFDEMRLSFSNYNNVASFAFISGIPPLYATWGEMLAHPLDGIRTHLRYRAWKSWVSYEEELVNVQIWEAAAETVQTSKTTDAFLPELSHLRQSLTNIANAHPNWRKRFAITEGIPFLGDSDNGLGSVAITFLTKAADGETARRMAVTAIALKRYQLRHGHYPAQLKELTPDYLAKVPIDFMDGKPLRYRRKDDGTFLLYSLGEDGKDDGGDGSPPSPGAATYNWAKMRDAVWPSPATADEVKEYEADMLRKVVKRVPGQLAPPMTIPPPTGTKAKAK